MPHWSATPDPRLARFVESFRFSTDEDEESTRKVHRIVPDGCVDLIFSVPVDARGRAEGECRGEVFGAKSRARLVGGSGRTENVAVHFRPGAAARFLGLPAHAIADEAFDLVDAWGTAGARLRDRIAEARDFEHRRRALESALLARLEDVRTRENAGRRALDAAVERAMRGRGRLSVSALALSVEMGERRLERLFREHVGLSPKLFSRVVRFDRALRELRGGRPPIDVALACGYSDQPHLAREFRAFSGLPPRAFLSES